MSDKRVNQPWWPWVWAALAGSLAGLALAALFVWVVGL